MSEKLTVDDIDLLQAAMECLYMESTSEPSGYESVSAKLEAMRKAAPEVEQEPAAWRAKSPDRIPQFFDCERDARLYCGTSEWIIEPLYLHQQPAPRCSRAAL